MINFQKAVDELRACGIYPIAADSITFRIPNAREQLWHGLQHFTGGHARWLPAYEKIAAYLTDNQGRGLLLQGPCGVGKSLICWNILPILMCEYCNLMVEPFSAHDINRHIDRALKRAIVTIDDVGVEAEAVSYGNRRQAFTELVDNAERKGHLLFCTTNLNERQLAEKYGERTMDRLVAITTRVKIEGESMRG